MATSTAERSELDRVRDLAASRLGRPLSVAEQFVDIVGLDIDLEMGKELLHTAVEEEKRRQISRVVRRRETSRMEVTPAIRDAFVWMYDRGREHAIREMRAMGIEAKTEYARTLPARVDALLSTLGPRLGGIDLRIMDEYAEATISSTAQAEIIRQIDRRVPGALAIASDYVSSGTWTGVADIYEINRDLFPGWEYSAVMDGATCSVCEWYDGQRFDTLDALYRVLPNFGPNPSCHGGSRCRCRGLPVPPDDAIALAPAVRPPVETLTPDELRQEDKRLGWAINKANSEHRLGRITIEERDRRLAELVARREAVRVALKRPLPPVVPPPAVAPPVVPPVAPPVAPPPPVGLLPSRTPVATRQLKPGDAIAVERTPTGWNAPPPTRAGRAQQTATIVRQDGDTWVVRDPDGGEFMIPRSRAKVVKVDEPPSTVPTLPQRVDPIPTPSTLAEKIAQIREQGPEGLGVKPETLKNITAYTDVPADVAQAEVALRAVGKQLADEIDTRTAAKIGARDAAAQERAVRKAQDDFDAAMSARMTYERDLRDKIAREKFGLPYQAALDDPTASPWLRRAEIGRLMKRDRKLKTLTKAEDDKRAAMRAAQDRTPAVAEVLARREAVLEVLGEVRPMGGKIEASFGRGVKPEVEKASRFFPTDWIESSNTNRRKLKIHGPDRSGRGYYRDLDVGGFRLVRGSNRRDFVTHSQDGAGFATLLHELSHVFQYARKRAVGPGREVLGVVVGDERKVISIFEWAFVRRRTTLPNGQREPRVHMGRGYRRDEMTRKDKFIEVYIGKDYGDGPQSSSEVLTIGVEDIFTRSNGDIWRNDPEMRDLILGILALL